MEYSKDSFNLKERRTVMFPKYYFNGSFLLVVVKATWSPKICFLEKVENLQKMSNSKLDLYERAVTIDGKDYHSHTGIFYCFKECI